MLGGGQLHTANIQTRETDSFFSVALEVRRRTTINKNNRFSADEINELFGHCHFRTEFPFNQEFKILLCFFICEFMRFNVLIRTVLGLNIAANNVVTKYSLIIN